MYAYINSLNEEDLNKLLIIFAQSLTLFAEYNFNAVLPLSDIKINDQEPNTRENWFFYFFQNEL